LKAIRRLIDYSRAVIGIVRSASRSRRPGGSDKRFSRLLPSRYLPRRLHAPCRAARRSGGATFFRASALVLREAYRRDALLGARARSKAPSAQTRRHDGAPHLDARAPLSPARPRHRHREAGSRTTTTAGYPRELPSSSPSRHGRTLPRKDARRPRARTRARPPRRQQRGPPALRNKSWIVYAKRPFGGPEQVLRYLGRYTHRVGISNRRLIAMDARAASPPHQGRARRSPYPGAEMLARFVEHVLPPRFVKIRPTATASTHATTRLERARELPTASRRESPTTTTTGALCCSDSLARTSASARALRPARRRAHRAPRRTRTAGGRVTFPCLPRVTSMGCFVAAMGYSAPCLQSAPLCTPSDAPRASHDVHTDRDDQQRRHRAAAPRILAMPTFP